MDIYRHLISLNRTCMLETARGKSVFGERGCRSEVSVNRPNLHPSHRTTLKNLIIEFVSDVR